MARHKSTFPPSESTFASASFSKRGVLLMEKYEHWPMV
jgi:hypothetical protein